MLSPVPSFVWSSVTVTVSDPFAGDEVERRAVEVDAREYDMFPEA